MREEVRDDKNENKGHETLAWLAYAIEKCYEIEEIE